jgi:hypothetical protein
MAKYGSVGWTPFYCRGKFATIQCDFACMISPPMCRRFVIPALAEEAAHLDACTYHYDGPGALVHFDDICAIPDIHVIQWVQGAGRGSHLDWVDLLKRFQAAGKGLDVAASFEQAKVLHRELRPERVLYQLGGLRTRADAEAAIRWFEKNT